jgi:hypothetical protein
MIAGTYFEFEDLVGTIDFPPEGVAALTGDWEGLYRMVPSLKGLQPHYYVTFDTPQTDGDGDGPYLGSDVPGWALVPHVDR